jgi:hypothetical protein
MGLGDAAGGRNVGDLGGLGDVGSLVKLQFEGGLAPERGGARDARSDVPLDGAGLVRRRVVTGHGRRDRVGHRGDGRERADRHAG